MVHICTPPQHRAELVTELAELGFRRLIIEKPLAAEPADLAKLAELVHERRLQVSVVAPWLASTLTDRLEQLVHSGEFGALKRISVRQHKPRFRRSLVTHGHPTAFDIEIPHALGVALLLAGDGEVTTAHWHDLRVGDQIRPLLGGARLELAHHSGVHTEIVSDLTSPVRERRITLRFAHGTAIGHFPGSADDEYAQLRLSGRRMCSREVFADDALSSYLARAYRRFLLGSLPPEAEFDGHVKAVRLLSEAKRISGADLLLTQSTSTEREFVLCPLNCPVSSPGNPPGSAPPATHPPPSPAGSTTAGSPTRPPSTWPASWPPPANWVGAPSNCAPSTASRSIC